MPPPNAFKRPSPMSDEEDGHSSNGGDSVAVKKFKADSEEESNHSYDESLKPGPGRTSSNVSPPAPQA